MRRGVIAAMRSDAEREPARECCGLLAGGGGDGAITSFYPAANCAAHPATSYEIAPRDLFRIMREIRAAGLELLGIYHSHPMGDSFPSARDIERAFYADATYFILSPRPDAPKSVRAFSIRDGKVMELEIQVLD
ncbi:MAG TPA: M67 family metallopeptidase [Candidatus Acidoferrales bacterium]